jgi:tRNA-2-methylthio-N6-dimethylallyladenosine synthase
MDTATKDSYHIITFGCQQNVADTDYMARLLERQGMVAADSLETASVVLINTCSVREKPENKVYSRLGDLKRLKSRRPGMILGVCGCQAQREGEELRRHAPHIDVLLGTARIEELPFLVEEVRRTGHSVDALNLPTKRSDLQEYDDFPAVREIVRGVTSKLREFVPIMFGCDKFCTFCIVPFTRGRERSRPLDDIVAEVSALVSGGTREVTLLGQTVDSWKTPRGNGQLRILSARDSADTFAFPDLLRALDGVPGLDRIRFTSPHPHDCTPDLIAAMRDVPAVCEWIHLPVQAGSNEVLERMHRGYTRERFLDLVAQVRAGVPDVAITTDVMVGFPGETEEQFEDTLDLFERVRFDGAYTFVYSVRPGTKAAEWPDQIPEPAKSRRLRRLSLLQQRISREMNEAQIGRVFEVLVDGPGEKPGQLKGLSRQNKTVHFDGPISRIGELVPVRAEQAFMWGFLGTEVI